MGWNKSSKIKHILPENKWASFTSEKLRSFGPGFYGVTILTEDRRIAAIKTTVKSTLSAFDNSDRLLMATGTVPNAKVIFNALSDNVIRFVWNVSEVQVAPSATDLGYIPVISGTGLKLAIQGAERDSEIPGFDIYMVGGNLDETETEPRIKNLGAKI